VRSYRRLQQWLIPLSPRALSSYLCGRDEHIHWRNGMPRIIPGLLLIVGDMVIVHYLAKKRNYPRRQEAISVKELAIEPVMRHSPSSCRDHTGRNLSGYLYTTEAAAVAAAYALLVGIFITGR